MKEKKDRMIKDKIISTFFKTGLKRKKLAVDLANLILINHNLNLNLNSDLDHILKQIHRLRMNQIIVLK